MRFAICASTAMAIAAVASGTLIPPVLAQSDSPQQGSLALPVKPVPAPTSTPAPAAPPPQEETHARSAHHTLKLDLPQTEVDAGGGPLQGAGPPKGNPPSVTVAQGAGPMLLSPLQGAGPMSAREMLLGSASTLGTK